MEFDLDRAHMTYEVNRDRQGPRAWFALEIRRVLVLGRPLHADAHVTLITGHRSAVERAPLILRSLEMEFSHWKRNSPDGLRGFLRLPPVDARSPWHHYAWALLLPIKGIHERLHQAVALARTAHAGPIADLVHYRRAFHISFQTDVQSPW